MHLASSGSPRPVDRRWNISRAGVSRPRASSNRPRSKSMQPKDWGGCRGGGGSGRKAYAMCAETCTVLGTAEPVDMGRFGKHTIQTRHTAYPPPRCWPSQGTCRRTSVGRCKDKRSPPPPPHEILPHTRHMCFKPRNIGSYQHRLQETRTNMFIGQHARTRFRAPSKTAQHSTLR